MEKTISIPLEEIKSTIDFQPIWTKFENSKITLLQILTEAFSYVEAKILKRALITIGLIVILAIIGNQFGVEKSNDSLKENQPAKQIQELEIDSNNQPSIARKEYPSRFDV